MKMDIELRDYFAAKAMASLITETGLILDTFADDAYEIADKMMVARDKRREETQTDAGQSGLYGMPQGLWHQPWRGRVAPSPQGNGLG